MYRKNVAGQYLYFALVNASTGAALTGATVTGKRAIDGAAQASATGTITEEAGGQYKLALSQADVNGNNIGFLFTATNAIPVSISVVTTAADPTDSTAFGLSRLDAAISSRLASAGYTAPDSAATIAAAVWAAGTRTLSSFGTLAADVAAAVWAAGTRTLSAFGFTVATNSDSNVTAIKAKTDNLPASPAATSDIPSANTVADALLDRADAVETGWTVRKALRIISAALAGKLSGAATSTVTIRSITDGKDRITATVDADGNRTGVTLDGA